ncbi:MAG: MFS transporter [Chloroflexota bacterium]
MQQLLNQQLFSHPMSRPIYIPTILLAFGRGLLLPVLPIYLLSLDISYTWVTFAIASMGMGTIVGDLPAGFLLGRLSAKKTMQLGIGSMGLALLAMALIQSYWALVAFYFLVGVGTALYNISRHFYLRSEVPLEQRGRAIAIFGGTNRIGTFAGPVIGGYLSLLFGPSGVFIVFALLAAVAYFFPTQYAVERAPKPSEGTPTQGQMHNPLSSLRHLFQSNAEVLIPAGIGQFFAQGVRSGRTVILPLYGADVLGLDEVAIGWIMTIASGIDMSLFYPAGLIMDRLGRKFAYVPSFLIQGIAMALIPFTTGFFGLAIVSGLMGFGNGLGSGSMMTLGADLAPTESTGEFLGIWRLIGDLGQTSAPIVVGNVADIFNYLPYSAWVVAAMGIASGLTFGWFVPETLRRDREVKG